MLAEEAKACFSPWSTCWLHSSLEFEKSQSDYREPLIYAAVLTVLLIVRLRVVKRLVFLNR